MSSYPATGLVIALCSFFTCSWNIISNVDASIGEKVSVSAVYPPPRLEPTVGSCAETSVAILTLPNIINPAGWTACFHSSRYSPIPAPVCTS